MTINNEKIKFIKDNLKIQEVIEFYSGAKFDYKNKCCCPLPNHNEDTPSFTLNLRKGQFRCYGCGAFGDLIDFVMLYFNITINEAMNKIISDFKLNYIENTKSKSDVYKEEQIKNQKKYESKRIEIEIERINKKIIPKLRYLRFQSFLMYSNKDINKQKIEEIKNEINKYEEIYLILNGIKINDIKFSQKQLLEYIESGKIKL